MLAINGSIALAPSPLVILEMGFPGLVEWLGWYCTCLASVRPCIQTPLMSKKKEKRKKGFQEPFVQAGLQP
jgi:hypothetical protein